MQTGMDIKNIRMSIATAAIVVVNTIIVMGYHNQQTNQLERVAETTGRTEKKVIDIEADNKVWKAKIEAEYSEMKVRLAILEQKVTNLEINKHE